MSQRELDALFERTLRDPRIPASTRTILERALAETGFDDDDRAEFVARAMAFARDAVGDAHLRQTLGWLRHLADLVDATPLAAPRPKSTAKSAKAPKTTQAEAAREEGDTSAYFSPGSDCLDAILREFDRAKERADVCVFTITDDRIRDAMLRAKRRGVALRVITDGDKSYDEGSDVAALERAGVPVRADRTEAHMHHKFAVFDGRRLLTGSYNWTRSAANVNAENVIVTRDASLVRAFSAEFDSLWGRYATRA